MPRPGTDPLADEAERYTQCRSCAHFVGPNPAYGDYPGIARYEHFEDGEQEFDHDPHPAGPTLLLSEWRRIEPGLFTRYPDGKIGPNSVYYDDRRGKADALSVAEEGA